MLKGNVSSKHAMMLNKLSGNFQFKNFEMVGIITELLTNYRSKSNIGKDNTMVLKVFGSFNSNFSDSFIPTYLRMGEKLLV